jgi:hypothetical protein
VSELDPGNLEPEDRVVFRIILVGLVVITLVSGVMLYFLPSFLGGPVSPRLAPVDTKR